MEQNPSSSFSKEIFIRNLSFTTSEESLRAFFKNHVPESDIEFCLIVKDKETGTSKGTAFLKLKTEESYDRIMTSYKNYNKNRNKSNYDFNPFELDGRNLKFFEAVTKDKVKEIADDKKQKESNRKKEYLYYGLSNETIKQCELFEEITETDKERREKIIEIKKNNFNKNPNYHVSLTRLTLRNFEKNLTEGEIKQKIYETLNKDKAFKRKYKGKKLVKQIKLLKNEDDKSKCVCFVECIDFELAKFIIDKLSGYRFNDKSHKGLILDFTLDDFRKRNTREQKLQKIQEEKKQRKLEKKKQRHLEKLKEKEKKGENGIIDNNENKEDNEKKENKLEDEGDKKEDEQNKVTVSNCNDIPTLISMYKGSHSRGRRQRIKKKLKSLGYDKEIPRNIPDKTETEEEEEKEEKQRKSHDNYIQMKIIDKNTELNRKMKDKKKKDKLGSELSNNKKDKRLLGQKRKRNENGNKFDIEGEEKQINKKKMKNKKEKGMYTEFMRENKEEKNKSKKMSFKDEEEDDDGLNMSEYYNKIMKNLNKSKK